MPCLQWLLHSCSHFLPQDKKEQQKLLQQHLPLRRTEKKAGEGSGRFHTERELEQAGSTVGEHLIIVVAHRCHNWVELLFASLYEASMAPAGTMKAGLQRGIWREEKSLVIAL